jgi:hypothetical protein
MISAAEQPSARELPPSNECQWSAAGEATTGDFVHFVIHLAARASGERCALCTAEGPLLYA